MKYLRAVRLFCGIVWRPYEDSRISIKSAARIAWIMHVWDGQGVRRVSIMEGSA